MSEESKKPPVRIPEYRPHFAGWAAAKALLPSAEKPPVAETATLAMPADDFAAIGAAEAPPPSHGRRLWATPVLSAKPFAGKPALRGIIAPPDPALEKAAVGESASSESPPQLPIEESAVAEFALSMPSLEPIIGESVPVETTASEASPAASAVKSTIAESEASELLFEPVVEESTTGEAGAAKLPAEPALETPVATVRKPAVAPPWTSNQLIVAAAAVVAVLAILMTRPWRYFKNASPPADLATQSLHKPEAFPSPIHPVAKPANEAAAPAQSPIVSAPKLPAAATVAALAPMRPAAVPSVAPLAKPIAMLPETAPKQPHAASSALALPQTMPSIKVATIPAGKPAQKSETPEQFTRVRGEILAASIESELAQAGYASLGLSVNDEGDVFLAGTFLSQADEDRVLAMIRHIQHVRDIHFTGTVWQSEQASAPSPEAPVENAPSAAQAPLAKPAAAMPEQAPDEFPVTAADVPTLETRRAASPTEKPAAAPTLGPR